MSEKLKTKRISLYFKEAEAIKILPNKEDMFSISGKIFITATPYYRRKLNNGDAKIYFKNISIANCSNYPVNESYGKVTLK